MKHRNGANAQMDLFVPFLTDASLRDQIDLMERPFFSLAKNKRLKEISYQSPDGKISVNVKPHQSFGMATIWDADILIWAASQLNAYKNRGVNDPPRVLRCRSYDLLKAIGRGTGGYNAGLLGEAIDRLKSTIIKTNIRPNDGEESSTFSWIDSGAIKKRRKTATGATIEGQDIGVAITLSDWFYRSVLDDRALLSIDPAYFSITGGRERWLYRVARKHAGAAGPNGFAIKFPTLFEKSGAEGTYRRFKFEILKIIERNALPGFDLFVEAAGRGGDISLRMVRKGPEPVAEAGNAPPKALRVTPVLTDETLQAARRICGRRDIYALKAQYDQLLGTTPQPLPDDYQEAFIAFVHQA